MSQTIGLGDLVRASDLQVQGIVKGLSDERLVLDCTTGSESHSAGDPWVTINRQECELVESGYAQKHQKRWS